MFKTISLLVFCCFVLTSFGQSSDYSFGLKISPDKLKIDFSILLTSLEENHPGLYDFISKKEYDALVEVVSSSFADSLTETEFHIELRKFIKVIGCGHTSARPSKEWYKAVTSLKSIIPIHVFVDNEDVYVRNIFSAEDENLVGSRIISIDGVSAKEILSEMKSILERDGVNETMVHRNVERLFQTLYTFLYGVNSTYFLEAELLNGEIVNSSIDGGKSKKYTTQKSMELIDVLTIPEAEFGIIDKSKKIAVLDLNSFPSKGYEKFYRKVFDQLAGMDSVDLIIDLRGNSGGYFPNGNLLLRYLMNESFTMNFDKPQKHTKNSKYLKLNFLSQVSRFVMSTIPDKNKEDADRNYEVRFKPKKKNHFDNDVYVLTDGLTFSTSSFVTSKLKNARHATVVGEETGGGEVGLNAVLSWGLTLPNSQIIVTIPLYHVDQQPEMTNIGRGVIPNEPIHYNLKQRMDEVDLELERVIQLLESK